MVKFANVLKATIPPKNATNYPNSGNRAASLLAPLAKEIAAMVAGAVGGSVGGIPAAVAGYAAAKGVSPIKDWRTAVQATRAFSGDLSQPLGEKIAAKIGKGGQALPRLSAPVTADITLLGRPGAYAENDRR